MKKITIAIIAIALVAIGGIMVFGQTEGAAKEGKEFGKKGHHPNHGMRGKRGMGMMLRGLDLTDVQKEQIKAIVTASREGTKSLKDQMRANREQIQELSQDGSFDEARISELAGQQGAFHAQMIVEREKVKSQIFALLTPEQKAKAAEMRSKFKQKFEERMQKRGERMKADETQQ